MEPGNQRRRRRPDGRHERPRRRQCADLIHPPALSETSPDAEEAKIVDPEPATPAASSIFSNPPAQPQKALLHRWLHIDDLSHSERYRNAFRAGGFHFFNNAQQRNLVAGKFLIDPQADYFIGFRASSGHYFNWAYSDYFGGSYSRKRTNQAAVKATFTPAQWAERVAAIKADPIGYLAVYGTPSNGWEFYLRELYASATPVKQVTLEFGSFGIERGVATEATTFDYDGYLSGERIRIHDAKHLFFDQVGLTTGFFGYTNLPSVFARGTSFKTFNCYQAFADKKLNDRVAFSGSYTWQLSTNALREAILVGARETKAFDKVRLELYQRTNSVNLQGLNVAGASGFAVEGERKFGPRVSGDIGFADIDGGYTAFSGSRFMHSIGFSSNGDTIGQGKRPFVHASVKLNQYMTATGCYTHAVGPMVNNVNQQGMTGGITFDFKALVNAGKKVL